MSSIAYDYGYGAGGENALRGDPQSLARSKLLRALNRHRTHAAFAARVRSPPPTS